MTENLQVLNRIPLTVFLFLGITRERASRIGMIGCGLQLGEDLEFSWSETTITLSSEKEEVKLFLRVRNEVSDSLPMKDGMVRITILQMETYISLYPAIEDFIDRHRRYKYLRLGHRAYAPSWELNSQEAFLIRMSNIDFDRCYVVDPRGPLTHSEVLRQVPRHQPLMLVKPDGLPDPRLGGWI